MAPYHYARNFVVVVYFFYGVQCVVFRFDGAFINYFHPRSVGVEFAAYYFGIFLYGF